MCGVAIEVPEMVFWFFCISDGAKKYGESMITYRSRGAADARAQDARARSLNIDDGAVVGVAGLGIVLVGSTDCADGSLRSRGVAGSVGVVVAGGNGKKNTRVDEGRCGVVDGG